MIVLAVIVVGLVLGIPKLRNYVVPPTKAAAATLWAAVRSPRRVALLLGGNAINALMYAGVYMACIDAFGGSINFWTLLSLNIIISTLASLVPIPGRQHRGVVGRHVGRARGGRGARPTSRSPRCSPTSWSPASSPRSPAGGPPTTSCTTTTCRPRDGYVDAPAPDGGGVVTPAWRG